MWLKQEYCTLISQNNLLAWMEIWAFAAVRLVLFISTSFRHFLMFLHTFNYNAWTKRTSRKLLFVQTFCQRERQEQQREARWEKTWFGWMLPACQSRPKRKFEIKMVTWVVTVGYRFILVWVSHRDKLRGRGDHYCWVYVSWLPLKGSRRVKHCSRWSSWKQHSSTGDIHK